MTRVLLNTKPLLIIVMGVSGTGKSTLAKHLSEAFAFDFIEADDFHTTKAKSMMSNGVPLTAAIRQEWVNRLCSYLANGTKSIDSVILAYSGLKKAHRQQFREIGFNQLFIMLTANKRTIKQRMENREGHFVSVDFLDSQLTDLEYPTIEESDVEILDANESFTNLTTRASELCIAHKITSELTT
ncbi:gluconokinase [Thalassotalea atypica]|uniref:gluconokinase n=1 Tax=Thalassotalea atypica TaxID=2054316 RepID=UPI002572B6FC|nr:gluconokinase [Thalassotalea atypica]